MPKRSRTRRSIIGAPGLLLCAVFPAHAAGSVTFDITYVDQMQGISPITGSFPVHVHAVATLHDGNWVTEQRTWQSPIDSGSTNSEGAMGAEVAAGGGSPINVTWHVESATSLFRYRDYPQHVETLHISASGQNCGATVQHRLKPGFTSYERFSSKNEPLYFSSVVSSGISCRVSSQ
jgi:hypothetical protein